MPIIFHASSTVWRWALTLGLMAVLGSAMWSQQPTLPQGPDDLAFRRAALAGHWTLHPYQEGTPPPPPPPFSSQRSEQDKLPPLETVARANFRVQEGAITGSAVFPEGIVLTEENQDVTGREAVTLENLEFDGKTLKFTAMVEGRLLEAELQASGSRFLGKWRVLEEDRSGDLYLVRRR